jgi:hypothetical protein
MSWLHILWIVLAVPLAAFVALFFKYIVAINYERGGWWRVLVPLAIRTAVLDIALNYTLFALFMWDRPRKGETTMSKHLERLVFWKNRRGAFCRAIAKYFVNPWDKVGGPHIPIPDSTNQ